MTSVKDACPDCHEWINRCTCPPKQPCDCVSDHGVDISDGPCGCPCHLKAKPETLGELMKDDLSHKDPSAEKLKARGFNRENQPLGFERGADTIANTLMAEWPKLGPSSIWLNLRRMILEALEAAFSKGIEEQEKRCGTHCVPVGEKAFSDGWNACRIEAAKLVEHWNKTMWSHEQLIEQIRALKPAKGESK